MAEFKQQQEILAQKAAEEKSKKEEEMAKKREETRATLAVRKVIYKMRAAQGKESLETMKQEFAEVMANEAESLCTMKDKLNEEADQVITSANARFKQLQE